MCFDSNTPIAFADQATQWNLEFTIQSMKRPTMLNPEFHSLCQIATSLSEFQWQFWIFLNAIAKAKKLICKSKTQNLGQVLLTKRLFSFGNGV